MTDKTPEENEEKGAAEEQGAAEGTAEGAAEEQGAAEGTAEETGAAEGAAEEAAGPEGAKDESADAGWGEAMDEQKGAEAAAGEAPAAEQVDAKPASFGELKPEPGNVVSNLEMILDIPVTVSVEIGRAKMIVKELLALGQGAVIELEKLAGETMEIFVNGRFVARGEAVVVNDKFGVKLTDILSPGERINSLK